MVDALAQTCVEWSQSTQSPQAANHVPGLDVSAEEELVCVMWHEERVPPAKNITGLLQPAVCSSPGGTLMLAGSTESTGHAEGFQPASAQDLHYYSRRSCISRADC